MNKQSLDDYITGHYGEDQFPQGDDDPEAADCVCHHQRRWHDENGKCTIEGCPCKCFEEAE